MKGAVFILALTVLFGCGTQPQLSEVINDMVVVTNYEPKTNFKLFGTYIMTVDTVGLISNTTNANVVTGSFAQMITDQVKSNLDNTGHTQVTTKDGPEFGVNISVIENLSISQSVYYPGGAYSGYYGYGYGYGPIVTTNYSQQAILAIEFVDLSNTHIGGSGTIWVANIGDLVNSYDYMKKTKEAIDQAFVQSTYLQR